MFLALKKEGVADLCMCSSISVDEVSRQLEARLKTEQMYTSIGDVLIAVNPYKRLPIYGQDYIQLYANQSGYDAQPHIFGLAQNMYFNLCNEPGNPSQAVIISGESGAGKTESAKLVLTFISAVSGTSESSARVKSMIESSNPLLESFGNAKTVRNDNSSRFGKYLEIKFNARNEPISGQTHKFLLERSRVAAQAKGERNFHIFYQLVQGCTPEMREAFGLAGVNDYYFLAQSQTTSVAGVDDAANFHEVLNAMKIMHINDTDQWRCFQVLAAILHIGNIQFEGDPTGRILNGDELKWAAYLLSVEEAKLTHCLTHKIMASPKGSIYEIPQNAIQCNALRDALAKALYGKVFSWLVDCINSAMQASGGDSAGSGGYNFSVGGGRDESAAYNATYGSSPPLGGRAPPPLGGGRANGAGGPRAPPPRGGGGHGHPPPPPPSAAMSSSSSSNPSSRTVGVLDIYGFEIFAQNGYEQFCINYVNERLQQIFIDLTLRSEQKEYHDEDMKWKDVQFFDNKVVVELLDGKQPPGIFRIMDDICRTAHAVDAVTADARFLEKITKTIPSHPHLVMETGKFTIRHYAGDVQYTMEEFTFKNKDNLFLSIVTAMNTSAEPFVKNLFGDFDSRAQPPTSSMELRQSADMLITRLSECYAHYIRCIKPNETKSALSFESSRVKHQIQYLGLVENVKVKKSGFSYRHYYPSFVQRFYRLLDLPSVSQDRNGAQQIIDFVCSTEPSIIRDEFGYGRSKIFVKSPETIFIMSEMLEKKLDPEGYKLKLQQLKQVEKLAERQKKKQQLGSLAQKCVVM